MHRPWKTKQGFCLNHGVNMRKQISGDLHCYRMRFLIEHPETIPNLQRNNSTWKVESGIQEADCKLASISIDLGIAGLRSRTR